MEWCRKRRDSRRSRVDLLTAPPNRLPKEAFPDEFAELLQRGMTRRRTGLLLLGTLPESAERELMLTEALEATTDVGPAGLVSNSYRSIGADLYADSGFSADGSSYIHLRRFQNLRIFRSVESAYTGGCRRIAVEYKCEPYGLLPSQLYEQYVDDVCFILFVDVASCTDAFERATTSTWQDLDRLIGALCWSGFLGTRHAVALYDAFVPGGRPLPANQYERAADAVREGRQLRWERQALRLLDSNQVTWRQLRKHLYTSGLIDPELDFEAADWSGSKEGLREWLLDQLVQVQRKSSPTISARERLH